LVTGHLHPTASTTTSYTVTLNLDINLESSDSNDHLNSITVGGIPEHATFSGNYTDVAYDAINKVYVLTFASDTTHYSGQVSVELPDGKSTLGDITSGCRLDRVRSTRTPFHL
jgi:hypothetical protein